MYNFFDSLLENPITAAIDQLSKLNNAIKSPCENIFLLKGNIFNLKEMAFRVQSKEKGIYIDVDNIDGFSKDTWSLEYIVKNIRPDGIITSKANLIKLAKDMGAFAILKLIIYDSNSLYDGIETIKSTRPHVVEIMPGIMPNIINKVFNETKMPIIASGLIMTKDDVEKVLNSGAIGISSSNEKVWYL